MRYSLVLLASYCLTFCSVASGEESGSAAAKTAKRALIVLSAGKQVLYLGDDLSVEVAEERFGKKCLMLRCDQHQLSLADEKKSCQLRCTGNVMLTTPHYAARATDFEWNGDKVLLHSAEHGTQWQGLDKTGKPNVLVECSKLQCDWLTGEAVQFQDAQRGAIIPARVERE